MKKCLVTLFTMLIFASSLAQSDNNNHQRHERMKTYNVEVNDEGQQFQLDAKTVQDMPNAVGLEIGSLSILAPKGKIPGVLAITLRPAGDMMIDMVGPQHGSFTFSKAEEDKGLPQNLPLGRYLLTIDGQVYGMLVVKEGKVVLHQHPQKPSQQPANGGE